MRIKTNPEDFSVEEKISFSPAGGDFALYQLTKRNWNTIDAIRAACAATNVPFEKVRYGGRKDRQAVTKQYLTCPKEHNLSFKRHNVEVEFVGFCGEPMSPSKITANEFSVIVRDMTQKEADEFTTKILEVKKGGFVNFFDEQRFGGSQIFFAELLIKRQFDRALKMWVCHCHSDAPPQTKSRKGKIAKLWGNWHSMLESANNEEKNIIGLLSRDSSAQGMIRALRTIPREEFGMYLSAYQSYIWNKVCEKILEMNINATEIPTIAPEILPTSDEIISAITNTLAERGVRLSKLKLGEFKELGYFSSFMRRVREFPKGLEILQDDDELQKTQSMRKITLKFSLSPGSYATMLLKCSGVLC